MTKETGNFIIIGALVALLFVLSGYNNARIRTLSDKVDQLEIHHVVK